MIKQKGKQYSLKERSANEGLQNLRVDMGLLGKQWRLNWTNSRQSSQMVLVQRIKENREEVEGR